MKKKAREILRALAIDCREVNMERFTNILNEIAKGTAHEIYEPYIDGSIAKEIVEKFGVKIEK